MIHEDYYSKMHSSTFQGQKKFPNCGTKCAVNQPVSKAQ